MRIWLLLGCLLVTSIAVADDEPYRIKVGSGWDVYPLDEAAEDGAVVPVGALAAWRNGTQARVIVGTQRARNADAYSKDARIRDAHIHLVFFRLVSDLEGVGFQKTSSSKIAGSTPGVDRSRRITATVCASASGSNTSRCSQPPCASTRTHPVGRDRAATRCSTVSAFNRGT